MVSLSYFNQSQCDDLMRENTKDKKVSWGCLSGRKTVEDLRHSNLHHLEKTGEREREGSSPEWTACCWCLDWLAAGLIASSGWPLSDRGEAWWRGGGEAGAWKWKAGLERFRN